MDVNAVTLRKGEFTIGVGSRHHNGTNQTQHGSRYTSERLMHYYHTSLLSENSGEGGIGDDGRI